MTALPARLRAAALATGAALAVLLLCWAAAAGPAALVQAGPSRQRSEPPPAPPESAATRGHELAPQVVPGTGWLAMLLVAAATVLLVVLLAASVRALRPGRRWWRPGTRAEAVGDESAEVSEEVRRALRREGPGLLATLDVGAPADGIVACWLRLERSVAQAGVRRSPWETSSEYAVRVLRGLDLDPRAVAGLAALYREARFSDHRLGEEARSAARSHLERVAADLQRAGA